MNEPLRYFNNAKDILKKSPITDNRYADVKYVQEACSTAYLATLKAIDEFLLNKGLTTTKKLSKSVEGYRKALQKHLAVRNGKLMREFEDVYHELHIAGYYRGDLRSVGAVKEIFKTARSFIKKIQIS